MGFTIRLPYPDDTQSWEARKSKKKRLGSQVEIVHDYHAELLQSACLKYSTPPVRILFCCDAGFIEVIRFVQYKSPKHGYLGQAQKVVEREMKISNA
jgi:hypothetical protein